MLKIPTPDKSFSTIEVPLSGDSYLLTYRYNSRTNRWKMDISSTDGTEIKNNISLIEGFPLINHLTIPEFDDVIFVVARRNATDDLCSRDNLGVSKDYTLTYITFDELLEQ